jgi:hypothetical protein
MGKINTSHCALKTRGIDAVLYCLGNEVGFHNIKTNVGGGRVRAEATVLRIGPPPPYSHRL